MIEVPKEFPAFNDPDYKKLEATMESIEDPIILVLRLHLFTETILERIIVACLPKGYILTEARSNFSYYNKLQIVAALDCIEKENLDSLINLNTLRNELSHNIDKNITLSDIDKVGRPLGKIYIKFKNEKAGSKNIVKECLSYVAAHLTAILFLCIYNKEEGFTRDKNIEKPVPK